MRRTPRSLLFPYTTLFRSADHALKFGGADKVIVLAVFFTGARRPGGVGNRHANVMGAFQQGFYQAGFAGAGGRRKDKQRSEEHTSELQSRPHLVCRLLLEK